MLVIIAIHLEPHTLTILNNLHAYSSFFPFCIFPHDVLTSKMRPSSGKEQLQPSIQLMQSAQHRAEASSILVYPNPRTSEYSNGIMVTADQVVADERGKTHTSKRERCRRGLCSLPHPPHVVMLQQKHPSTQLSQISFGCMYKSIKQTQLHIQLLSNYNILS